MYINIITLKESTLSDLRSLFPWICFPPSGPDAETLARINHAEVIETDPPVITESQTVAKGPAALADGVWTRTWVVAELPAEAVAANLEAAKTAACTRIDARAEELRCTVLTPGAGQMAAYQAKEEQAEACRLDPAPDAAKYPDLANEIGITANTLQGVAEAVYAAAQTWRTFGRAVERARLEAKKAIRAAVDLVGVAAAEAAVAWPAAG